jgi:hypothetical protein
MILKTLLNYYLFNRISSNYTLVGIEVNTYFKKFYYFLAHAIAANFAAKK